MQILESHTIILLIIVKILVHCTYLHKQKNASLVIFSQSLSLNEIQILASFFGEYVYVGGPKKLSASEVIWPQCYWTRKMNQVLDRYLSQFHGKN